MTIFIPTFEDVQILTWIYTFVSYDDASGSEIMPFIKIDKPFGDIMHWPS